MKTEAIEYAGRRWPFLGQYQRGQWFLTRAQQQVRAAQEAVEKGWRDWSSSSFPFAQSVPDGMGPGEFLAWVVRKGWPWVLAEHAALANARPPMEECPESDGWGYLFDERVCERTGATRLLELVFVRTHGNTDFEHPGQHPRNAAARYCRSGRWARGQEERARVAALVLMDKAVNHVLSKGDVRGHLTGLSGGDFDLEGGYGGGAGMSDEAAWVYHLTHSSRELHRYAGHLRTERRRESPEEGQCTATTKAGARCTLDAVDGTLCRVHSRKANGGFG